MIVWRCGTHTLSFDRPLVMGILNITPDSFSDGGRYLDPAAALERARHMEADGAAIIDVGAQSTRPGATLLSPEEEWARLAPVLPLLTAHLTVPLSVDTFEPFVAARALQAGASVLNDVSGSMHNGFFSLAAQHGAGLICMARDAASVTDVTAYFGDALRAAAASGLPAEHLCLDMGIGFHADQAVDLALIAHTAALATAACARPLLCGASRKRVVAFAADDASVPAERLGGSLALHLRAAVGGATLLRTHDVRETVQALAVCQRLSQLA